MATRHWLMALAAGIGMGGALGASPRALAADDGGTLTISDAQFLWTCGFSPYNSSSNFLAVGPVYETLMFVNTLQSAKTTPWLATDYSWSADKKVLTFTMRHGVKFTDGTDLTPSDVVFTFNMLKKYPALDLNTIWSQLTSVAQSGDDKVVFTFKIPAVPYFYYVADQVGIVPEHIWSKVKDPTTFVDATPIGTGPYTISRCTPQDVSYTRNPNYWQPGLPKIAHIEYPAFTTNPPANQVLATGQAQWGGQFIPNIKTEYMSKDKDNHYWYPPVVNVAMFINQTNPILKDVAVRKALVYALDKKRIAMIGEYGYEPPANQAGIVTPTFESWLDKKQLAEAGYTYDPKKAIAILEQAGYKRGDDGMFSTADGKPLAFTIINQSAYTDWVAALQVAAQQLKAVGIKLTISNLAGTDYNAKLFNGQYDLAYAYEAGGPTPYYEFRQWLYSPGSAPIGQAATTNWERYSNKDTDALIDNYAESTDPATQQAIVTKLQKVLLDDVPLIPITEQVDWDQYSTKQFVGWPTPQDPYAQPLAGYTFPDWGVIVLHLHEK
ncbi:ABC transporter substrate-binding protein [Acidisoma cellulosilytica]|uniref:ABC transporter substrate-binding protein n=1 Tax=Acidisoma cellulosilyticum TaxID=2802395 RepID=A0A963YYH2_9PROT|nr:ABC transporter substrate-binding protein [Acidisoma cellulosilyticum]MCB8878652.1 ABC transporter substrate-binding protein [Acidisoma cellulosilyticum]